MAGYSANGIVLDSCLEDMATSCSRDVVRNHIRWLEEQGLLTVEEGEDLVAKLTGRGDDVPLANRGGWRQRNRVRCKERVMSIVDPDLLMWVIEHPVGLLVLALAYWHRLPSQFWKGEMVMMEP